MGSGHPVIDLLGELDALPGLNQKVQTTKEPVFTDGSGQSCSHNLLNTACLTAAIRMKAEMEEKKLSGTIVFYGCSAEEVLIEKAFLPH